MRRLFLSSVFCTTAACGGPAKPDANAPANQPAVINMPSAAQLAAPLVDSAKKRSSLIPEDPLQWSIVVGRVYSLATATMVNQDARQLEVLYAPDATLRTPELTVKGSPAIVQYLLTLSKTKSLSDFQRRSRSITVLDDSTVTDTGYYDMTAKRTPKDSVVERGQYATRWRARADPAKWIILEDHLMPGKATKKRTK